ncbi:StlD/DarB family beta-ketosynthase [Chitinibacter sp. ZOR0017]|uniref:StlD/DarB family beta-ketosynthase n=1 Tax=Chitinibacter sp. ZOR0017 TaxID=1339254 RepID=UPI0006466949|nr:StlD/DarB family beta-ketosynthase [Chitinibacter sp. ZOR0017]
MPIQFDHVYLAAASHFLPGEPVDNQAMDAYIAPLNRISGRIKQRILAENGIQTRHYAIDASGHTRFSHAQLAAQAVQACLAQSNTPLSEIGLLTMGSSGGDALMPGFANMLQGELGAPPMQTLSSQGVCAAGVSAIEFAAQQIELGAQQHALAVAAEMPSRMFKRSRFAPRGYQSDFDAHFLRWMLSDGAGALQLSRQPFVHQGNLRIKLKWIHQKSFAGDYPVCMQLGLTEDRSTSFLDFPSSSEAEAAGALALRQDIRLLPHLFDVCIHEYVKLVDQGWIHSTQVDHFLCHYSSAKFMPVVEDLLAKAGLTIPAERWYSNLSSRGNTGAASIFIMLAEFLQQKTLRAGEKIFCFIPESGRITAAFMLFEVEDAGSNPNTQPKYQATANTVKSFQLHTPNIQAPHNPSEAPEPLQPLLGRLASLWQDYRSSVWRTPVIHQLVSGRFDVAAYRNWTAQWVPQVREGSLWMREAVASLSGDFAALGALIDLHASDEQNDFQILYQDYQAAGGTQPLDALRRNPGGEALNSYLHALAATPNPVGLLGAIYIIEGTGQRIVPALLPLLRQQVALPPQAFRFLEYHGANDEHHLARWLAAVEITLALAPEAADAIYATARRTAQLYLMQFDHIQEPV